MIKKWSQWFAVSHWLDHGWNNPSLPWEKGVYRFRIRPAHRKHGGEIVYIGRAGEHTKDKELTSAICSRVATFITAGMGFWTAHSGGNRFFARSINGSKEPPVHELSVRDLEVSYVIDDDPVCRENEELQKLSSFPAFNKRPPRTCRRGKCKRAKRLWATYEKWW